MLLSLPKAVTIITIIFWNIQKHLLRNKNPKLLKLFELQAGAVLCLVREV